jgi:endothelin-converting enzyme/putative endopeptidase
LGRLAKLRPITLLLVLSCYEVTETGAVVRTPENPVSAQALVPRGPSAFGLAPVNTAAEVCTDFAAYACGAEASWGKVQPESDLLGWRTASIWRFLDELAAGKHQDGKPGTAVLKELYTRCKNPRAREAGLDDLRGEMKRIDQARSLPELVTIIGDLHRSGAQILIRLIVTKDADSGETPFLARIGLMSSWLQGRKASSKAAASEKLRGHWRRLAALTHAISPDEVDAALEIDAALDVESTASGVTSVDLPKRIQRAALASSTRFPWGHYLAAMSLPETLPLAPAHASALERADKIADLPFAKLKSYVRVVLLEGSAGFLGESFLAEEAAFHRADAVGGPAVVAKVAPMCVVLTEKVLEPQLAAAYLPGLARDRSEAIARELFEAIRDGLGKSIDAAEWLDPFTRRAVRAKVDALKLRLIDDADGADAVTTKLPGQSLLAAMRHLVKSHWALAAQRFISHPEGAPVVPPSLEVGAFFSRSNAIWLSPEIVRLPFLRDRADDPISVGALGTILGHELAHVLSPSARRYDAAGSFRETWSPDAVRALDGRAACLTRRPGAPGDAVSWTHARPATVDEALSDLVGVGLALRVLEGSTSAQSPDAARTRRRQFFLAYAQMTCASHVLSPAEAARVGDPHPPPRFRINTTVANIAAFADAFGCQAGAPLAPRDRCGLW